MNATRPTLVWAIAALCAATVLAALAVVSSRVLDYETERAQAAAEAELGDRVRLALWRMESEAAAILTVENSRPVDQFRSYFTPAFNWDVANSQPAPADLVQPSPLLDSTPEYARLHFEIDADGLRSPQVPLGRYESLAGTQGILPFPPLDAAERLTTLRDRLGLRPDLLPETLRDRVHTIDLQVRNQSWNEVQLDKIRQTTEYAPQITQNQIATNRAQDAGYDRQRRAESVARVAEKGINPKILKEAETDAALAARGKPSVGRSWQKDESGGFGGAGALAGSVPQSKEQIPNQAADSDPFEPPPTPEPTPHPSPAPTPSPEPAPAVTPYQASWIGGDLFLIRRVGDDSAPRIQGVWLENGKLKTDLLEGIADLLPKASLDAIDPTAVAGPLAMVSLPFLLVPGESTLLPPLAWSPTHDLLTATWAAVVVALLAAFALLFGVVRLSERRASFVSSVTHELRTPLTTFKLYSEMLAEDMVPDPQRRRDYLDTLRREAERLGHLVENVLSYSRIERGSARARRQQTTAAALIESILPRLRDRAASAGLEITAHIDPAAADTPLETDLTAVEQILFNLVDNAAKYGLPVRSDRSVQSVRSDRSEAAAPPLELTVRRVGRHLAITLRDHGPGVSPEVRRKLFRPFSKSAAEAAATQPGVGLGLALSRRLARSLGGDLTHHPATPGTRFTLSLP